MEDALPRSPSSPGSVDDRTMLCGLTGQVGGGLVPTGLDGVYEKNLARGGLDVLCLEKKGGGMSQKPERVQGRRAVRQHVGTSLCTTELSTASRADRGSRMLEGTHPISSKRFRHFDHRSKVSST